MNNPVPTWYLKDFYVQWIDGVPYNLKAGFEITGAYEDFSNESDAIADGIPSFWATKAVKSSAKRKRLRYNMAV